MPLSITSTRNAMGSFNIFTLALAQSSKVTKRRLPSKTLELIRQRGIVGAAGNRKLTSGLAKQCRHVMKEDLREKRAGATAEAAEAGKSIRRAHRSFANYKTKMIALRRPDGTVAASERTMEKIIHEYYSDLFDSHVHLPSYEIKKGGYAVPPVLLSEIQHTIPSVNSRTARGLDSMKPKRLRNLPPVLVNALA
ncbi:unnamed protein product [Angiostrongylus costaricensis]|uniref:Translation protein SH3-like domain-containing protein n=1 Tax=Angiostrongylus costaricensis TaxID=334426 RepID=A0A0R3Q2A9_ANGCS|nr:unnamed protein product [Angiostrongylus costaricensis]